MPFFVRSARWVPVVGTLSLVACLGDTVAPTPGDDAGSDVRSSDGSSPSDGSPVLDANVPDVASGTCSDGQKNQSETDVDCGGVCGQTCALTKACLVTSDCKVGACIGNVCKHSVLDVAIGNAEICAIRYPGALKCWGRNTYGQLGRGDVLGRGDKPATLPATFGAIDLGVGRSARAVAVGGNHACAILDDGSVKCWGRNNVGQLGLGDSANRGDLPNSMGNALPPVQLGTGRTAKAIASFEDHTCVLLDDASLKCWGSNTSGQLGLGDVKSRGLVPADMGDGLPKIDLGPGRTAKAITLNHDATCALLDDATLKCWGSSGALIPGNVERGSAPGQMGANLPTRALGTGRTVVAIASGYAHQCALLDNATVKCWGYNLDGRLGVGDLVMRGSDATMGDTLPAIDLGSGRFAKTLSRSGSNAMCAILDDKSTKCWGLGAGGALGSGDTQTRGTASSQMGNGLPVVDFGAGRTAAALYGGFFSTCALLDDDSLKCWGPNGYGQLGLGDTNDRGDAAGEMGNNLPPVAF